MKQNCFVNAIPKHQTKDWLIKKHYARRIPPISYAFGLYIDGILSGVCTFGPPCRAFNNGEHVFDGISVTTFELNRLCVDSTLQNITSYFVSQCLKLMPQPCCVVSYADESFGHKGYIYQATNFLYTGLQQIHEVEYLINGKAVHSRTLTGLGHTAPQEWAKDNNIETTEYGKRHRYFIFVGNRSQKRNMANHFKFNVVPYPKGETTNYDASQQIPVQGLLC